MEEVWKDIKGYEGLYKVSNLGSVKSVERKVRVGKIDNCFRTVRERLLRGSSAKNNRYIMFSLYSKCVGNTFYAHQLVAIAFLGHKPNMHKLVVDHIDNNPLNNRLDNLQIISQRKNVSKNRNNKYSNHTGVSWDVSRDKWVSNIYINKNKKNLGRFTSEKEAHLAYQNALKNI